MSEPIVRHEPVDEVEARQSELDRHTGEPFERLKASMAPGRLLQPIGIVEGSKKVLYGHGRLKAARELGWKTIECKVFPSDMPELDQLTVEFVENYSRHDISPVARCRLCETMLAKSPGMKSKDLAAMLGVSAGAMTRILRIGQVGEPLREALEGKLITQEQLYKVSGLTLQQQLEFLAQKRDGLNGDGGGRHKAHVPSRRAKSESEPAKSRITIPVTGATVNISGQVREMTGLVAALESALEEVRIAGTECDFRGFVRMLRQRGRKAASRE
jgi:ParB/RepB/Spo0J family partition protein